MRVDYLSRFDRSFEKLDQAVQKDVQQAIVSFLDHVVIGSRPQGLGLRRLRGPFWEIRIGLRYRALFEMKKDWITFIFVGSHDEVRKFLRGI